MGEVGDSFCVCVGRDTQQGATLPLKKITEGSLPYENLLLMLIAIEWLKMSKKLSHSLGPQ